MANYLLRNITKLTINDIGTTYRAYKKEIIKDIRLFGENHRFIPVFANIVGAKICEIKIKNVVRLYGSSNYNIGRALNVFIDLFFLYFVVNYLDKPSRIFGKIALIFFGIATVIFGFLLYVYVTTSMPVVREHSGLFISGIMLYIVAIQLLLTGIVSEILTRVYFSTQNQTTYKIRNVWENIK